MAANTVIYNAGLRLDTSEAQASMKQLMQTVNKISTIAIEPIDTRATKEGIQMAQQLEKSLRSAFNVKTGNLDLNKFSTNLKAAGISVDQLRSKLVAFGPTGASAFNQLASSVASAQLPLKQTNAMIDNLMINLKKTAQWQISSSLIHGFVGQIQSAIGYVHNLNTSLTNISVVSDLSSQQLAKFAADAQKMGKALSASTLDVTNAALIYFQQGDSVLQSMEKAAITIKAANASANSSAAEMSEYLTAIWNSYQVGSAELEKYVDIMAALGAKTATSMEEIATSMQKVAATANTVGVGFDQMSAIISTVSSVTRESAESVGTAYKTILARMGDLKLGNIVEDGVEVSLGQVSKALDKVGIKILDAQGNMRDMGSVVEEVMVKWQGLALAEKTALAQQLGGKRQYTQLMALFENADKYQEAMAIAASSEGSLNQMQDKWAQGWDAAANRVKNSMQGLYSSLIDDKFAVGFLNVIAEIIGGVDSLIDKMGGLGSVIAAVGGIFASKIGNRMHEFVDSIKSNLGIATGATKRAMANMQAEFAMVEKRGARDPIAKSQAALLEARSKYTRNQDHLSLDQRESFQMHSESYARLQNEQKQLETERRSLNAAQKTAQGGLLGGMMEELTAQQAVRFAEQADRKAQIQQESNQEMERLQQRIDQKQAEVDAAQQEVAKKEAIAQQHREEAQRNRKFADNAADQRSRREFGKRAKDEDFYADVADEDVATARVALQEKERQLAARKAERETYGIVAQEKTKEVDELIKTMGGTARDAGATQGRELIKQFDDALDTRYATEERAATRAREMAKAREDFNAATTTEEKNKAKQQAAASIQAEIDILQLKPEEIEKALEGAEGWAIIEGKIVFSEETTAEQMAKVQEQIDAVAAEKAEEGVTAARTAILDQADDTGKMTEKLDAYEANAELRNANKENRQNNESDQAQLKGLMDIDTEPIFSAADAFGALGGAIGSVIGIGAGFKGVWDAIADPDMSGIEKATAILTGLMTILMSASGAAESFGTLIKVGQNMAEKATKKNTAATMQNTGATIANTVAEQANAQAHNQGAQAMNNDTQSTNQNTGSNLTNATSGKWGKLGTSLKGMTKAGGGQGIFKSLLGGLKGVMKGIGAMFKGIITSITGAIGTAGAAVLGVVAAIAAVVIGSFVVYNNQLKALKEEQTKLKEESEKLTKEQEASANKLASASAIINNDNMSTQEQIDALNELGEAYGISVSAVDAMSGSYASYTAQLQAAILAEQQLLQIQLEKNKNKLAENSIELASKDSDNALDWLNTGIAAVGGALSWTGQGLWGLVTGKGFSEFNSENYHDWYDDVKVWERTALDDFASDGGAESGSTEEARWTEFAKKNKERLAEIGMYWDPKKRTLRQSRELEGEDYKALYDMMIDAGAKDWGGDYTQRFFAEMEGDWGFDLISNAENSIRQSQMVESLLTQYSDVADIMNTQNRNRSLQDLSNLMTKVQATSVEDQKYLAEYLTQYSHWSDAGLQYQAIIKKAESIKEMGQASGLDAGQITTSLINAITEGQDGLTLDLVLKLNPTAITIDDKGGINIRETAKAAAQAELDREKYVEVEAKIKELESYTKKEKLTKTDYDAIIGNGVLTEAEAKEFMNSSPAHRMFMVEQKRLENEAKDVQTLEDTIRTNTEDLEALEKEKEKYFQELESNAIKYLTKEQMALYDDAETPEDMYEQMVQRRNKLNQQVTYRNNYAGVTKFEDIEDKDAYKKAALAAMTEEQYEIYANKTAEEIFNARDSWATGGIFSGNYDELNNLNKLLEKGMLLTADYAETQAQISEAQGDLETAQWWRDIGQQIEEATNAAKAFSNVINKDYKNITGADLANIALYDEGAIEAYARGQDYWLNYIYESSVEWYNKQASIYGEAGDAFGLHDALQARNKVIEIHNQTLKEKMQEAKENLEDLNQEFEENFSSADGFLTSLRDVGSFKEMDNSAIQQFKMDLLDLGYTAEEVDDILSNLGKGQSLSEEETSLAVARTQLDLLLTKAANDEKEYDAYINFHTNVVKGDASQVLEWAENGVTVKTLDATSDVNVGEGENAGQAFGSFDYEAGYKPKTTNANASVGVSAGNVSVPDGVSKPNTPTGSYTPNVGSKDMGLGLNGSSIDTTIKGLKVVKIENGQIVLKTDEGTKTWSLELNDDGLTLDGEKVKAYLTPKEGGGYELNIVGENQIWSMSLEDATAAGWWSSKTAAMITKNEDGSYGIKFQDSTGKTWEIGLTDTTAKDFLTQISTHGIAYDATNGFHIKHYDSETGKEVILKVGFSAMGLEDSTLFDENGNLIINGQVFNPEDTEYSMQVTATGEMQYGFRTKGSEDPFTWLTDELTNAETTALTAWVTGAELPPIQATINMTATGSIPAILEQVTGTTTDITINANVNYTTRWKNPTANPLNTEGAEQSASVLTTPEGGTGEQAVNAYLLQQADSSIPILGMQGSTLLQVIGYENDTVPASAIEMVAKMAESNYLDQYNSYADRENHIIPWYNITAGKYLSEAPGIYSEAALAYFIAPTAGMMRDAHEATLESIQGTWDMYADRPELVEDWTDAYDFYLDDDFEIERRGQLAAEMEVLEAIGTSMGEWLYASNPEFNETPVRGTNISNFRELADLFDVTIGTISDDKETYSLLNWDQQGLQQFYQDSGLWELYHAQALTIIGEYTGEDGVMSEQEAEMFGVMFQEYMRRLQQQINDEGLTDTTLSGYYLALGLINGFTQTMGADNAIVQSLQAMLASMNFTLGIASPSKRTMEMGQWLIEGFNQAFANAKFDTHGLGQKLLEAIKTDVTQAITETDMTDLVTQILGKTITDAENPLETFKTISTDAAGHTIRTVTISKDEYDKGAYDKGDETHASPWTISQDGTTYTRTFNNDSEWIDWTSGNEYKEWEAWARTERGLNAKGMITKLGYTFEQLADGSIQIVDANNQLITTIQDTTDGWMSAYEHVLQNEVALKKTRDYYANGEYLNLDGNNDAADAGSMLMYKVYEEAEKAWEAAHQGQEFDPTTASAAQILEFTQYMDAAYKEMGISIINNTELTWSQVNDIIEGYVEGQIATEVAAAKEVYDNWVNTFKAIAEARKIILEKGIVGLEASEETKDTLLGQYIDSIGNGIINLNDFTRKLYSKQTLGDYQLPGMQYMSSIATKGNNQYLNWVRDENGNLVLSSRQSVAEYTTNKRADLSADFMEHGAELMEPYQIAKNAWDLAVQSVQTAFPELDPNSAEYRTKLENAYLVNARTMLANIEGYGAGTSDSRYLQLGLDANKFASVEGAWQPAGTKIIGPDGLPHWTEVGAGFFNLDAVRDTWVAENMGDDTALAKEFRAAVIEAYGDVDTYRTNMYKDAQTVSKAVVETVTADRELINKAMRGEELSAAEEAHLNEIVLAGETLAQASVRLANQHDASVSRLDLMQQAYADGYIFDGTNWSREKITQTQIGEQTYATQEAANAAMTEMQENGELTGKHVSVVQINGQWCIVDNISTLETFGDADLATRYTVSADVELLHTPEKILEEYATMLNMTNSELKEYISLIEGMDEGEDFDLTTTTGALHAAEVVRITKEAGEGLDTLRTDWSKTFGILKKETKVSTKELASTMNTFRKNMGKIFNVRPDLFDDKFIEENLDNFDKLMNGTEEEAAEAGKAIEKALLDKILKDTSEANKVLIDIDHDGFNDELATAQSAFDAFLAQNADAEVGSTVNLDTSSAISGLNSLLSTGVMTADGITEALNAIGWQPEITWEEHTGTAAQASQAHGYVKTLDGGYEEIGQDIDSTQTITYYIPKIGSVTKTGSGAAAPSLNPSSSGGGGGGGGKPKKLEKKDPNDEKERYHEINERLERMNQLLDKVNKYKDRAFGKSHLKNLEQEIKLMKQQEGMYERKLAEAKEWLEYDKGRLAEFGVTFDEMGNINNYDEVMEAAVAEYNAFVDRYNAMSADEQKTSDENEEQKKAEEKLENLKEYIDDYEESINNIYDLQNQILETQNKQSASMLEKIQYKAEYQIEINEDDIELLEYFDEKWEEVLDKQDDRLAGMIEQGAELHDTLSLLATEQQELDAAYAAGTINLADYVEGLREVKDSVIENLEEFQELQETINELYGDTLEMVSEKVEEQTEHINTATEAMGSYITILGLMGRGKNFRELETFYAKQVEYSLENAKAQRQHLDLLLQEKEYYDAIIASGEELNDTQKIWYQDLLENIDEVSGELLSSTEEVLNNIASEYENVINGIFKELDEVMGGAAGSLAGLADQYSYYTETQERYVTSAKELYEVSKLNRDIERSIEDSTTTASKQMLAALKERINAQSELNELTEYDIEMNRLQYELALAKIGLEEAQNAKDTVRLTRDESGNYVYQYTANDDKINEAEQKYEDVLQQINELAYNRVTELEQMFLDAQQEYYNAAQEIANDTTLTTEERTIKLQELYSRFCETQQYIQEQYQNATGHIMESNTTIAAHYNDTLTAQAMNSRENINETIAGMIEDNETYKESFRDAIAQINEAQTAQQTKMNAVADTTLTNYGDMIGEVERYGQAVEDAGTKLDEVLGDGSETEGMLKQIDDLGKTWGSFAKILDETVIPQFEELLQDIIDTIKELANLETAVNETNLIPPEVNDNNSNSNNNNNSTNTNNNNSNSGGGGGDDDKNTKTTPTADENKLSGWFVIDKNGNVVSGPYSSNGLALQAIIDAKKKAFPVEWEEVQRATDRVEEDPTDPQSRDELAAAQAVYGSKSLGYSVKKYLNGGLADFTGPAWLDGTKSSPELILNATDTQNMLSAIGTLRKLDTDTIAMLVSTLNAATASLFGALSGSYHAVGVSSANTQELNQNVEIHADFPNVTDRNEIVEAIDDLVNRAAQFAQKKVW